MPKPRGKKKKENTWCQKPNTRARMKLTTMQSKTLNWHCAFANKENVRFCGQPSKHEQRLAYIFFKGAVATIDSLHHHLGTRLFLLRTADPPRLLEAGRWYPEVLFSCRGCWESHQCCMGIVPWRKLEPAHSAVHRREAWQWVASQRGSDLGLGGCCSQSDVPSPAPLA